MPGVQKTGKRGLFRGILTTVQQPSASRYIACIERIPEIGKQHRPLFRYSIRSLETGKVVYEGHADDAAEADATARAHIEYLGGETAQAA